MDNTQRKARLAAFLVAVAGAAALVSGAGLPVTGDVTAPVLVQAGEGIGPCSTTPGHLH